MDKETRNLLANTTQAVRRALEEEFRLQLEGIFDVHEDGRIEAQPGAPLDDKQKLVRRKIISAIEHRRSMGESEAESVRGFLREAAFTLLNRLAALKMMEARGIVLECVSACGWRDGKQDTEAVFEARGFKEFSGLAPGLIELPDKGYRLYLECLFDEIGREVGVLFDRTDSASLLWPRRKALADALTRINAPGLAGIWSEDETIGWIYQYYNDSAERRQMRDESAAPRNSREMAVRNQFFTPRYVVEFLTDNALGRLWFEMTKGQTQLKERCRYLIRQTSEVFLNEGENAPTADMEAASADADLQQRTLHIAHRPLKDPREIRMLDPACGSMHFGLYTFDLLEVIYSEAWDMQVGVLGSGTTPSGPYQLLGQPIAEAEYNDFLNRLRLAGWNYSPDSAFRPLPADYSSREDFLKSVPKMIIEHNIHGIDIDPRAAQMAGLAMWLRAQRAWQAMGLKPVDRPAIRRSNIVCAEPMPGEKELLSAFVTESFRATEQPFFQKLLDAVFEKMQIAGEAGALLQIEEEIRFLVRQAREAWTQLGKRSGELFSEAELVRADLRTGTQLQLDLGSWSLDALSGIPDAEFWEQAEGRIYEALRSFAERAESSSGFQRRLFAEDAARGFAFIDLCRQRYDVALMNPPFGDASIPSKPYIDDTYGDTKGDVYKAFVECFQTRLVPAGYLGIISSRTGFFLSGSEDWRTRVVLRLFRPIALADLGSGVLDAMVEVAAYVLRSLSAPEARDLTLSVVPMLEQVTLDKQERFSLPKWQAARGGLKRHQAVAELEHLEAHGFIQRSPGDIVRYMPLWHSMKKVSAPPEAVFPPLVCVRALAEHDKGTAVLESIQDFLSELPSQRMFVTRPSKFRTVPGAPFSYWVTNRFRNLFADLPSFAATGLETCVGLQTNNDLMWLRAWWEVAVNEHDVDSRTRKWKPFAKGGRFSPFYTDQRLVILWGSDGSQIKSWKAEQLRFGRITANNSKCWNESRYFLPGLTWPLRARRFSPAVLPKDCIFSIRGFFIPLQPDSDLHLLGLTSSSVFDALFKVALGRYGFPEYITGVLEKLPIPPIAATEAAALSSRARRIWAEKRDLETIESSSHQFLMPAVLAATGHSLAERAAAWDDRVRTSEETVAAIQSEIDDLAFNLYDLDAADRAALTSTLATGEDEAGEDEEDEDEEAATADTTALVADLLAYALGCAFGRWDIRYATGERPAPPAPDPFAPLPVCPPGMLQDDHGLPATPAEVPTDYPLRITWHGILVDDPGHPEHDIGSLLQEVMERLFPERPDAIEQEACELLGVKSLRDWFRKPADFFADHLKRYSKSRRQAPIYWPLSSPKGLYTIWIYYHRLNADTLFTALRDFLEPKLQYEEQRAFQLKQEAGPTPSPSQRRDLIEADDLVDDLRALKDELNRVAPLFRPNLNDGVILNCAPLWRMMSLPKWQKDCKAAWDSLSKGDYDWAHLALHLWPERVIPKCATDRSLAIAHGLEDTFWEITPEDELPKKQQGKDTTVWRSRKISSPDLQTLITTHTSPAIKAALEALGSQPTPALARRRTRG